MKGIVYHGNRDLRIETVEDPVPGRGEAKLRVDYCGICATDVEEYLYGPKYIFTDPPNPLTGKSAPLITGHELTATIVETGDTPTELKPGQRVVINGIMSCNQCQWCAAGNVQQCPSMASVGFAMDGGLAEFLVWPTSHIIPLPKNVTSREAALTEPAAVANHAVRKGQITQGDTIAVIGVGTVGMLALQIAKARGAKVIAIDTRKMSLDMARRLGADATILSRDSDIESKLNHLSNGVGPDVIIDAAGAPDTPTKAIELVRGGGRVVIVAIYVDTIEFDFNSVVYTEKEIIGSVAYNKHDVEEVVQLLSAGTLVTDPLISGIIGLDDVIDVGFKKMLEPSKDIFRILVSPSISKT